MVNKTVLLIALIVMSTVVSGCGQKNLTERQLEKNLEKNLGGTVDVDIDNEEVNIQTEEGSLQVGGDVQLPKDFPTDIYIIDGKLMSAMENVTGMGTQVVILSSARVQDAKLLYETKLKEQGWKILTSYDMGTAAMVSAQKDTRQLTVTLGTEEGKEGLVVMLTLIDTTTQGAERGY